MTNGDLRNLFSFPDDDALAKLDNATGFELVCRECGAVWEVFMRGHSITRGSINALLAHAESHKPGRPGIRRIG